MLHGVEGESAEIVRRYDMGLTFEPENSVALSECLVKLSQEGSLRERFRANCRRAAAAYDRQALAMSMLELLETTVRNGGHALEGH